MKKSILLIAVTLSFIFCFGQQMIKINDLNMPTSPAFVLMDKSPASIEKPSNPRAFAVSLVNVWQENGAIEFAPYWFKDRPAYTFEDNLNNKAPVFQTFGISAATSKTDSVRSLSVGFRTQLLRLYAAPVKVKINSIKKRIVVILSEEDPDNLDQNAINHAMDTLKRLQSKVTFNTEIAGAYMGQSSPSKTLASTKAGVWLNVRWTPYKFPLDFVLLARYSWAAGVGSQIREGFCLF